MDTCCHVSFPSLGKSRIFRLLNSWAKELGRGGMLEKRKVIILGGDGMFAWDMVRALKNDGRIQPVPLTRVQVDVTNRAVLRECIRTIHPSVLINTAGPLVDICEEDIEFAKKVNVEAVRNCAIFCQESGVRFIHLSTCGLFGDERKFYSEVDPVVLKTVYAWTKYQGERVALEACENTLIVRPGWMYGGPAEKKRNFVAARIREASGIDKVKSAKDKFGSPTWTYDAAEAVRQLIYMEDLRGVFNLCNSGGGSRAEYVRHILDVAGLSTQVEDTESTFFPRSAPVPDCELLANGTLNSLLRKPMADWRESLEKYVGILTTNSLFK